MYASKYLPSMFEFVQHQWLRHLDLDVTTLPLDHDLEMAYGTYPSQWRSEEAVGSWDIWPETQQDRKILNGKHDFRTTKSSEKVWVQFSRWSEDLPPSAEPVEGERLYLKKVVSR